MLAGSSWSSRGQRARDQGDAEGGRGSARAPGRGLRRRARHSVCARIRRRFIEAYATFRDLYKQASDRLRHAKHATQLDIQKQYPPGALVRPRWYIPAPANLAATWLRGVDDADQALA